jgi:hypothetical protein
MLKSVFKSPMATEAELVKAQLEGAGFHPSLIGATQTSSALPMLIGLDSEVVVPATEYEAVRTYLTQSKLVLDETAPSGVIPDGAVCPVHEGPAVALCERCGTFLCAKCGSLGTPPLCEDCVARPEASRPRPKWVVATARLWAAVWIGTLILGALTTLLLIARRGH